jgi:hypothetical protein
MSYFCGIFENEILKHAYKYGVANGLFKARSIDICYDGFTAPPPPLNIDLDFHINEMNNYILEKTGLAVKMKIKPFECYIQSIIDARKLLKNKVITDDKSFENVKTVFEETRAKIIKKSLFVENDKNKITLYSKEKFITSYQHLTYEKLDKHGDIIEANFIDDWLRNSQQKVFDDMEVYPSDINCPENIFNMWRPFEMENIIEYTPKNEEKDKLLNHIKILCGNDNIVYDYFCKWIGQMIKYPSVKTICPTLISKEGAGKGTFLLLMRKMLGNDKIFETTQPSRDVWGDFNGVMANTFLVNLNELSKKDTIENEGKIKGLITDPRLTINNKGLNKFEINSFHRFIITTNNEEPIGSKKDDRRNLIIRSSDEKIGDKEYFKNLHKILEDVNVIKTCYEYFKGLNDLDTFNKIEKPVTEYQANIQEGNRSHIELWLEDFTAENFDQTEVVLLGNEKFNLFKKWCEGQKYRKWIKCCQVWC